MTLLEPKQPMTIEAFGVFAETRPDEERWELIDGAPILNPSPTYNHQKLIANLIFELRSRRSLESSWDVLPGIGVKLSEISMPIPDVLLRPKHRISGYVCDDMMVAFEVLSPSSRTRDLRWKRQAYANLPSLEHYVVIQQDRIGLRCYDHAAGWTERRLGDAGEALTLPAAMASIPLASIYQDIGL